MCEEIFNTNEICLQGLRLEITNFFLKNDFQTIFVCLDRTRKNLILTVVPFKTYFYHAIMGLHYFGNEHELFKVLVHATLSVN